MGIVIVLWASVKLDCFCNLEELHQGVQYSTFIIPLYGFRGTVQYCALPSLLCTPLGAIIGTDLVLPPHPQGALWGTQSDSSVGVLDKIETRVMKRTRVGMDENTVFRYPRSPEIHFACSQSLRSGAGCTSITLLAERIASS